jgi:hypothetical protein
VAEEVAAVVEVEEEAAMPAKKRRRKRRLWRKRHPLPLICLEVETVAIINDYVHNCVIRRLIYVDSLEY